MTAPVSARSPSSVRCRRLKTPAAGRVASREPARMHSASRRRSPRCRSNCPSKARPQPVTTQPSTCRPPQASGCSRRAWPRPIWRPHASDGVGLLGRLMLVILAITLLVLTAPLLDWRNRLRVSSRLLTSPCCWSWPVSWPPGSCSSRAAPADWSDALVFSARRTHRP